jgi:hypothetical protein
MTNNEHTSMIQQPALEEVPKCIGCGTTRNLRLYGDPFKESMVGEGEYLCPRCARKYTQLDAPVVQIRDFSHNPVRDTIIDLNAQNPVDLVKQYGMWAQLKGTNNVTMTYYPRWQSPRQAMQIIFGREASMKRLEALIDRLKSEPTH